MESWIEVIDGYKVSNLGEVYSTKTNKILKPFLVIIPMTYK